MFHASVHVIAALKEVHREILSLRKDVDQLRDEVKVLERGNGIQFVLGGGQEEDDESESDVESVQSAPASMGLH
jgi:hypothetical protein